MCVFVHSFRNNWTQTKYLQIGWKIPHEKPQSCSDPIRNDNQNSERVQGQKFRTTRDLDIHYVKIHWIPSLKIII